MKDVSKRFLEVYFAVIASHEEERIQFIVSWIAQHLHKDHLVKTIQNIKYPEDKQKFLAALLLIASGISKDQKSLL